MPQTLILCSLVTYFYDFKKSFVVVAADLYCSTNNILGISAINLLCIEETDSLKLLFVLIFSV